MPYTLDLSKDFWNEFDPALAHKPNDDVRTKVGGMGGRNHFVNLWRAHRQAGSFPEGFRAEAAAQRAHIENVSKLQLDLFDAYFEGDRAAERRSLEDFGQGVIYDDRREAGYRVPMMRISEDIGRTPVEYFRWHGFARAAIEADVEAERWTHLDRAMTLAWKIQHEAKPEADNPNNPGLDEERLVELRTLYMGMDPEQLDDVWEAYPWPSELAP